MTEPAGPGDVVLDPTVLLALADREIRATELIAMLAEEGTTHRIVAPTLIEGFPVVDDQGAIDAVFGTPAGDRRPRIVAVDAALSARASELAGKHGVSAGTAVAAAYAIDHRCYLATWNPWGVRPLLAPHLLGLLIDLSAYPESWDDV